MGRPLVLPLRGEVDIAVATSLRPGWYALAEQERLDEIVVDLQGVTFMDASGLGLLVGTRNRQRQHGGDLRLCNACERVMMLLRLTGLSAVFPHADQPCGPPEPCLLDVREAAHLQMSPSPGLGAPCRGRPSVEERALEERSLNQGTGRASGGARRSGE